MKVLERMTLGVIEQMREDLADCGGVEVLWLGKVDEQGAVVEAGPAARGSFDAVPALFPHMNTSDVVIHNHPGGDLRPSRADLGVASRLGNQGIGFFIVDNGVTELFVVAEPVLGGEIQPLDEEELGALLEPQGPLGELLVNYESRPGQGELLREVAAAFNEDRALAAEAGTGTGKSFAYLLPALAWAAQNQERVVASTATIALQQQLMDKDIPLAKELLGVDVPVVLVKGRRNYLCLKRLEETKEEGELFPEFQGELAGIREWAAGTPTGDISDFPSRPREAVWSQVKSESDTCPGSRCAFFDPCFFMRARRKAGKAGLLVVNHHLLFADLAARAEGAGPQDSVVLPPFQRIILDEAHHVESSATALFTTSLSLPAVRGLLSRLHKPYQKKNFGLLGRLAQNFPAESIEVLLEVLPRVLGGVRSQAELLDALARDLLEGENRRRLPPSPGEREESRLREPLRELKKGLTETAGRLGSFLRELPEEETEGPLIFELRQSAMRFQEYAALAESFLHREEHGDQVFWLELNRPSSGKDYLALHRTPLDVAPLMKEAVWEPFGTVVSLSATLVVGDSFDHWLGRVGALDGDEPPRQARFASPFDFASQVMLGVPSDAPLPEEGEAWEVFLGEAVTRILSLSEGHALVLFTSYETLKKTLGRVRRPDSPFRILAQGDDDRGRLLKTFREDSASVLFATDSFWEGVDVPGEALQLVILTRLPFRSPGDPVFQARRDAVEARGQNAFMTLSLPEAVMKFRQGFGRLMRRSSDRGAVLVLDARVLRKRYGSLFLRSLPPAARSFKPQKALLRDLEDFLFPGG